jgi:hypothetical protein
MSTVKSIDVSYHSVIQPRVVRYPNDYKHRIHWSEKTLGGQFIDARIWEGELDCIDPGDYYEPPVYDIGEIYQEIIVRPKLKYWGKGIREESPREEQGK